MKQVIIIAAVLLASSTAVAAPAYEWSKRVNYSQAVVGGAESVRTSNNTMRKRSLYLCRGLHAGGVHPGKVVAGQCNIGYGGKEVTLRKFQLLKANQKMKWSNRLTKNAVVGGQENGRPLYVCRTAYKGGWHPGKIVAGNCNIGYGGKEIVSRKYQVLTLVASPVPAKPYQWQPASKVQRARAVVGGSERGGKLYICRAFFAGSMHPGKVVAGNCNIGYGGKEIVLKKYQMLTNNRPMTWSRKITPRTVVGGVERGKKLFVCSASYKGGMHPGKVVAGNCNIGYGGKEIVLRKYQVLSYR